MAHITSFHVEKLWGDKQIQWDDIHPDVNILVGINGSFKTTLLRLMYEHYAGLSALRKKTGCVIISDPEGPLPGTPLVYVDSIDVPARDKRSNKSALFQELRHVVVQNDEGISFFNYRMRILDRPEEKERVERRLQVLYHAINAFFEDTGKTITLTPRGTLGFLDQNEKLITLEQLSAGEKQILLILLKVFLLDEQDSIVFLDEPELAMHIRWQRQLIDKLRVLNPQAQLIITTHSPSVFSQGWGDKAVYMDQIIR